MPIAKISSSLTVADWTKKVGPLDKNATVANQLKTLNKQYDDLPLKVLETGGLDSVEQVKDRIQQVETQFGKAAKSASDQAKNVAAQAKKSQEEFKKDPKAKAAASAAGDVADAANALMKQLAEAVPAALAELKGLLTKLEAKEKKGAPAAGGVKKPDSKLVARKAWVKRMVAQMKSGKVGETHFAFAQNKIKKPAYARGKPWEHMSLLNIGPKATKSSKADFVKLMPKTDKFDFFFGEVKFETDGRYKGSLLFKFASPLGNKAQIKDALLFQCGYAPKFVLAKGTGEVVEADEGEGQDPGLNEEDLLDAEGGDEVEEGEGTEDEGEDSGAGPTGAAGASIKDFTKSLGDLRSQIQAALVAGGPNADKIKTAVAKAGELAGKGDVAQANTLLAEIRKLLAARGAPDAAGAGQLSLVKLGTARLAWANVRTEAVRGIEQLARRIEQEYSGEVDQRSQVQAATARLRALAGNLKGDLETQLDAALNENDAAKRTALMRAAKATLTSVLTVVATDPLMKELDGNELMPELQIVKPMQERLREIATALA